MRQQMRLADTSSAIKEGELRRFLIETLVVGVLGEVGGFYPRVPQFARSPPRKPDWQLFWIVRHGIRHSAWLSDKEAWEVVTFLSRLDTLPAAVQAVWEDDR